MPNTPTEVVEGAVWLGPAPVSQSGKAFDESDNSHVAVLRAARITHVVNCTPGCPFISAAQLGLAAGVPVGEHRVAVSDEDHAAGALDGCLDAATAFIEGAVAAGGRVYVHCETGKSRSATVVIAYRVRCCGESLRAAYNGTKAKRDYIQPKPAFFNKLVAREPVWARAAAAAAAVPSFPAEEYGLVYLLDHFAPYMWVDGVSEESIRAAIAEAGGDSSRAHAKLAEIVQRS